MAAAFHSYEGRKYMSSETSVICSEPRSINDLPTEILLEILSYFEPEDLSLVIAKVCTRWNELAKDFVLWKKLMYSCDKNSDISRVKEVLTNAPALDSLIIREREDAERILQFVVHIRYLRKLFLHFCYLGEDSTRLLANIVDLYPDLEVLSLEGCFPITSDDYHLISRLKKLSELNLSNCEEVSGETVRLIAESCQHLKKLSLDGVIEIDDDDVIHVIKKLGKQLTTLVLEGVGLTDVVYTHLKNCARLQELEVFNCEEMTDRGFLKGIESLHELTSLRLHLCLNLTAQAWSTFLHRPSMTSIVSLDLSACLTLDNEGLKGIAVRCIHLKELALCWCGCVNDAGISMVIKNCNQLRLLDLSGIWSITGNGWLLLVPSRLPHLRQLYLMGCEGVCRDYVVELVTALPELKIFK